MEGNSVTVVTVAHQEEDRIAFRIASPLIAKGRKKVNFKFPYGKDCHVCPGYDWENDDRHRSVIISQQKNYTILEHKA